MLPVIRYTVCRIPGRNQQDWGTGFFVEPRGLVLTCAHVLDEANTSDGSIELDVFQPEAAGIAPAPLRLHGRRLADEAGNANACDVALVELVSPLPSWIQTLDILADSFPLESRVVRSYGFPSNRPLYGGSADGIVIGLSWEHDTGYAVLEIRSSELSGGFSGAPIVDGALGYVVGIMMSTVRADNRGKSRDLSWAVPTSLIAPMLPRVRSSRHPFIGELQRLAAKPPATLLDSVGFERSAACMERHLHILDRSGQAAGPFAVTNVFDRLMAAEINLLLVSGDSGSGKTMLMRRILPALINPEVPCADGRRLVPLCLRASSFARANGANAAEKLAQALAAEALLSLTRDQVPRELGSLLQSPGYRFVILLDALDEITQRQGRLDAVDLIRDLSSSLRAARHLVILSSRPIDELDRFSDIQPRPIHAVLDPVADEERARYFERLLETQALDVERQFATIGGHSLEGSPLLIAFAVSVYSRRGALPTSLVQLYTQYLDLMLDQDRRRDGALVSDAALLSEVLELLQVLAFETLASELDMESARRTLERAMGLSLGGRGSTLVLRQAAQLQLDAILGMQLALYREGDGLRWRHQSIRDYFAGHYMNAAGRATMAWTGYTSHWRDDNHRMAVRFALLIRAEQAPLQSESLQAFAPFNGKKPDETTLDFLFETLSLGAKMADETLADLIDASFICGLENADDYGTCSRVFRPSSHPLEHLLKLCRTVPQAKTRLHAIIDNPAVSVRVRKQLAKIVHLE